MEAYGRLKELLAVLSGAGSLVLYLTRGMLVIPKPLEGDTEYTESHHLIKILETLGSHTEEEGEGQGKNVKY